MTTAARVEEVDMVDRKELLLMFRDYVDQCIEETSWRYFSRPKSFDEWYTLHLKPNFNELTNLIDVTIWREGAAGGFLTGSERKNCRLRIPGGIVTGDNGGIVDSDRLFRIGKKVSKGYRLPTVTYKGKRIYYWTWD